MRIYKTINPTISAIKHLALGLAATAAFLTTGAMPAHGQLIAPVAATAQSWYADDDRAPVHAIDGSGMTPNSPVTASSTCGTGPGGNMWLSNGNQDTWITFDLGSVQTIAGFHLWNYNEGGGFSGRGVKTAGIYKGTSLLADGADYTAAGPAWGTLVEEMTFTQAPETAGYAGANYLFAAPVTTRYLQIYVTANFGFDNYTGISEIRFIPAARIRSFGTNIDGSSAVIGQVVDGEATIDWTLPYDPYGKPGGAVLIAALSPTYTLSSGTCTQPNDGVTAPVPGFGAGPVSYTVTDTSAIPPIANLYTVTVTVAPPPPGGVTGLALWLDASAPDTMSLAGTTVNEWRDKMGSTAKMTSKGGSPALEASGIDSIPTVHFDTSAWMNDSVNHSAPVTIFYVSRQTGGSNLRVLGASDNNWLMGYHGERRDRCYFEGWVCGGEAGPDLASDTNPHLYAATIEGDGHNTTVWAEGVELASNQNGVQGPNNLELNGFGNGGELSDCDISEVLVYNRILSPTELNTIGGYLATKYGLETEYKPAKILSFGANVAGSSAVISPVVGGAATIAWTVPYDSGSTPELVAALAPEFMLSSGICTDQTNGVAPVSPAFPGPVTYTVTDDGTTNIYTVTVIVSPWTFSAWTGDADSGITSASPYTVAVNFNGDAVTVNGVAFEGWALSGANFSIGGDIYGAGGDPNISGGSYDLANAFIYGGNPRTVTLSNLTPGATYEASLFAFGWEGAGGRILTFASDNGNLVLDQDLYGNGNGIRIIYPFVADSSGVKVLTITPVTGTFHMSALANRQVSAVGGSYTTWAAANGIPGEPATGDFDHDGLANGLEFVVGGNPTLNDAASVAPTSSSSSSGLGFTFRRTDLANNDPTTTIVVEYGSDLVAWTQAQPDVGGVTIVEHDNFYGPGIDQVIVTLPSSLAVNGRLFARLKVTITLPLTLLNEDFEADDGGFTFVTAGGTDWAYGAPNSPDAGGGAVTNGAGGSAKCWGTNLVGGYAAGTDTSLRSPLIDLTGVSGATLSFARAMDAATGHNLGVNVLDNAGNPVAVVIAPFEDPDLNTTPWKTISVPIPVGALGQQVRLE